MRMGRTAPLLASHCPTTLAGIVEAKSKAVAARRRSAIELLAASKITTKIAVS